MTIADKARAVADALKARLAHSSAPQADKTTGGRTAMPDRFTVCLPRILAHEGGYVDHARDPGGATNLGITIGTLSDWIGQQASKADVRALTPEKVAPIYRSRYWLAAGCHNLPVGLDYLQFDAAVNHGPWRAVTFLQRAVGAIADGDFGPLTQAAVDALPPKEIIRAYADRRENFYRRLSAFTTFGRGWLRRLSEVEAQALSEAK